MVSRRSCCLKVRPDEWIYGLLRWSIRFDTQLDSILVTIRLTIRLSFRFDDLDKVFDDLAETFDDLDYNFDDLDKIFDSLDQTSDNGNYSHRIFSIQTERTSSGTTITVCHSEYWLFARPPYIGQKPEVRGGAYWIRSQANGLRWEEPTPEQFGSNRFQPNPVA